MQSRVRDIILLARSGQARQLTYDARGRRHAVTVFDGRALGRQIVIQGRRFDVMPAGAPVID